jgi:hypothetical protein
MRSILSISLPKDEKTNILLRAKKSGKSVSSYILHATKLEESLIQEDEIVQLAKTAEKDYKNGKTKALNNAEDLLS